MRFLWWGGPAAVAAVLGWAWLWRGDSLEVVPNDPSLRAPWACHACGSVYQLTPRDRIEWERKSSRVDLSGAASAKPQDDEESRTSSRHVVLGCPQCGKLEVHKAFLCPRCGTAFARMVRQAPQACPKCRWKPEDSG